MTALAARRRHPLATVLLLVLGLVATGALYAAFAPSSSGATASSDEVSHGHQLFLANCATCHGTGAQGSEAGPTLIGVGAAAVDFQVGTGRMPLKITGPQAEVKPNEFSPAEISALAAYVASLAPGPGIPNAEAVDPTQGDVAKGADLFRTNCAMCHNFAGQGGALTRGKFAPSLMSTTPTHIYEAMITGPQSMPVFNDANITPQNKRDIIAFLHTVRTQAEPGGFTLGSIGPVSEGLVGWLVGLGALIGCAVWLGAKSS